MPTHGTRVNLVNGVAVVIALGVAGLVVRVVVPGHAHQASDVVIPADPERQGGRGSTTLVDASGRAVPLRNYRRIASASMVADRVLLELCEPDRIVAFSPFAHNTHDGHRFSGKPVLDAHLNPEMVVSLGPDLLIVNNLARIEALQRLRDAGIEVFDLGMMEGMKSLLPSIEAIGQLVGRAERARLLVQSFQRRLAAVSSDVDPGDRPEAMYLGLHGGVLIGGTRGTSFSDVLTAAGFLDVAAKDFQAWPRYNPEQILLMNPEVIVTQTGSGAPLCRQAGMAAVRACKPGGRVLELPPALILDPGLVMLDAAERLHQLYFQPAAPGRLR